MKEQNCPLLCDQDEVEYSFVQDAQVLPLVITPKVENLCIMSWAEENKSHIDSLLTKYGGILFRGFDVNSSQTFERFIGTVSSGALEYNERSSPRHTISGNVYTSTDHPEDKEIFLHSEQSYNLQFPLKIFFYCHTVATKGGNTPIADARRIYNRIDPEIRSQFIEKQYRYSRYFWPMMGMPWQTAFQSNDKQSVETYFNNNKIEFKWGEDGSLSTYQKRPAVALHPSSGEKCWFNHCTFFHITTLDEETQEILTSSFSDEELPNNTYFGDGESISAEVMNSLRDAYEKEKVEFDWQVGDILMLDNMLTTHGRGSYSGERKIYTGMSDPRLWSDVTFKG